VLNNYFRTGNESVERAKTEILNVRDQILSTSEEIKKISSNHSASNTTIIITDNRQIIITSHRSSIFSFKGWIKLPSVTLDLAKATSVVAQYT